MSVEPVLYSFLNKDLRMDSGKLAAQAQHAAVEAIRATPAESNLLRLWYKGLHYRKVVLEGRDTQHMYAILLYLEARGFNGIPIFDEGLTDVDPHSFTAIGVPLVNKNEPHTQATFSSFKLYRDDRPVSGPAAPPKRLRPWWMTKGRAERRCKANSALPTVVYGDRSNPRSPIGTLTLPTDAAVPYRRGDLPE